MIAVEMFAKKKPNDRHWYAYDVLLNGEILVSNSRDPEHDLARALLARGIKGAAEVVDGKLASRGRGSTSRLQPSMALVATLTVTIGSRTR